MRTGWIALAAATGAGMAHAEFDPCRFNFGVDWSQHVAKKCSYYRPNCSSLATLGIPAGMDFVQMFVGYTQVDTKRLPPTPQSDKEGLMLKDAASLGATPVWVSYVIAEGAKLRLGIGDCNAATSAGSLCTQGSRYIRDHRDSILIQYRAYAKLASSVRKTGSMIWELEPDFVQYTKASPTASKQSGGALSLEESRQLLADIADTIVKYAPESRLSMDISPWIAPAGWYPTGVPLDRFAYMHTSGGISRPAPTIKSGEATWAEVFKVTGAKPMIADDGYGTGGGTTSPYAGWRLVDSLNARIGDGVIGLMEAYPGASWATTVASLRPQLATPPSCAENGIATGPRTGSRLRLRNASTLLVRAAGLGRSRLDLTDVSGRSVRLWEGLAQDEVTVSLRGLRHGIWFARLSGEGGSSVQALQLLP